MLSSERSWSVILSGAKIHRVGAMSYADFEEQDRQKGKGKKKRAGQGQQPNEEEKRPFPFPPPSPPRFVSLFLQPVARCPTASSSVDLLQILQNSQNTHPTQPNPNPPVISICTTPPQPSPTQANGLAQ